MLKEGDGSCFNQDYMYVIAQGSIECVKREDADDGGTVVCVLGRGDLFGRKGLAPCSCVRAPTLHEGGRRLWE